MKTLDEFIKRDDYQRANSTLIEKCIQIAEIIRKKMEQLDETEIGYKHVTLCIRTLKSNSGYTNSYLAIYNADLERYLSLEHAQSDYFAGDYTCLIRRATNRDFLQFANICRELIEQLDELETIKAKECKDACNNL